MPWTTRNIWSVFYLQSGRKPNKASSFFIYGRTKTSGLNKKSARADNKDFRRVLNDIGMQFRLDKFRILDKVRSHIQSISYCMLDGGNVS